MSADVRPIPEVEIAPAQSCDRGAGAVQHIYRFPNGYGASVVQGPYSYGGASGLWELAVLDGRDITYDTPLTADVLGHLDDSEVGAALAQIAALPASESATIR